MKNMIPIRLIVKIKTLIVQIQSSLCNGLRRNLFLNEAKEILVPSSLYAIIEIRNKDKKIIAPAINQLNNIGIPFWFIKKGIPIWVAKYNAAAGIPKKSSDSHKCIGFNEEFDIIFVLPNARD